MVNDLNSLSIWQEAGLKGKLPWYRQVADNTTPAKFRIAEYVPVSTSLADDEARLWEALDEATPRFLTLWRELKDGSWVPASAKPQPNLLLLCRELTRRTLRHCTFCRWRCGVNRSQGGKLGTCQLADRSRVSSYFCHLGEEPIYRGRQGSGTIFLTSCNMRCAFCQNGDISTDKDNGLLITPHTLATMAWLLRAEGCHNINWVGGEPTIHLHTIVEAISLLPDLEPSAADLRAVLPAKGDFYLTRYPYRLKNALFGGAFNAPLLWNSNFFMSEATMKLLRLLIDVWLPDLKFGPGACAVTLARTPWYWETVTANLKLIHGWGEDFTIRHLVMPNHLDCCTRPVLAWIAEIMPEVPVNIMDQYCPGNLCDPDSPQYDPKYQELARRPTAGELLEAYGYARNLGLCFEALSFESNWQP